jgi:Nucleotide modification associated domain 1
MVLMLTFSPVNSYNQKPVLVEQSLNQYDAVISRCKELFLRKNKDYGTAWRVLRLSSLTDQIYIKASRIRNIELQGSHKVEDKVEDEYIGIINYSLMALIQHFLSEDDRQDIPTDELSMLYDRFVAESRYLFQNKNHDYGEIWRDMRISSYTDLILMKILRIKQIEDNQGLLLASEGVDANYMDIINYCVFALIRIEEQTTI